MGEGKGEGLQDRGSGETDQVGVGRSPWRGLAIANGQKH